MVLPITQLVLIAGLAAGPPPGWVDPVTATATAQDGVLVIEGVARPEVVRVRVGCEELALTADRGYRTVRGGDTDDLANHPVTVSLRDGSTVTYPWTGPPFRR